MRAIPLLAALFLASCAPPCEPGTPYCHQTATGWRYQPQVDEGLFSPVHVAQMGRGQFMITCVDSPMYCAAQANKVCPDGVDVISNTTNAADFGRMTMIVRCRAD